ncbi:hypothetical protein ACQKKX_06840 [Neorhizobium sp. NPDC001467]|uniref:hypothetical protein n=1 Tax=Neorhizobium sp. NPDC001467 TaxID=3390595 RepID=UPI003CFEBA59
MTVSEHPADKTGARDNPEGGDRRQPNEVGAPRVAADEETEGATQAMETPATPPAMTRDGKVAENVKPAK